MSAYSHFRKFVMPAEEAVYRMVAMSRSNWPRLPLPKELFLKILSLIDDLRRRPAPA